jgi:hypothetical protein
MIDLFNIGSNDLVEFSPEALAIEEFRDIYNRDMTDGKILAWLQLSAAFFIASVSSKNPYRSYDIEDRVHEVSEDLLKGTNTDVLKDELVIKAVKKIKSIEEASLTKSHLRTAIKSLAKLRQYLEDVDLFEETKAGTLKHDAKKYAGILQETAALGKTLSTLENDVRREEQGEFLRLRGGGADELDI